jgi:hypothetical protein
MTNFSGTPHFKFHEKLFSFMQRDIHGKANRYSAAISAENAPKSESILSKVNLER